MNELLLKLFKQSRARKLAPEVPGETAPQKDSAAIPIYEEGRCTGFRMVIRGQEGILWNAPQVRTWREGEGQRALGVAWFEAGPIHSPDEMVAFTMFGDN